MIKNFILKIKKKEFSVCIIGLGYVGLPLASRLLKKKIKLFGIDTDSKKINLLRKGKSYIQSSDQSITKYFKKNPNNLSTNYEIVSKCDVIIVCLPTPLKPNSTKPDMSFVFNCAKNLKRFIKDNHVVILESTVYPGATREFGNKIIKKNFNLGKNLFLGYSPERENPGDKNFSYKSTPKVISGYSDNCKIIIKNIYNLFVKRTVLVNKIEEAELSKLLENLYRAVNIGLVNEMKIICNKLGIDIFNTIDAASTKNFGFQKFLPGPGLGGHCIPIDPFYLSWISKKNGYEPKFIKLAGIINSQIPNWTIKQLHKIIKIKKKTKILLLGVAYKKNTDDDRESPSFEFIKILNKKKIKYDYCDPYFPKLRKGRNVSKIKYSIKLTKQNLKNYDATILLTDHSNFDYDLIANNSKIILDTRGKFKSTKFKDNLNIIYS
ncbi:nucleotide sugar dehydrogenase [Candidatus Pelagibacter bacterium nBUS_25]|uniref:nucleotide sugar dehydrogenase n=1 Tax=Candidatus Pelagibacter bacterium nBUS_25 TaxID=3374187 RepID=UPI003EBE45C4